MSEGRVERRTLTFGVTGEFITQLVREQFYLEAKGYENAMEILLSCMGGTDMPEEQLKRYAEDVILGRAEFKGNTADGTFCMTAYDAGEEPKISGSFRIFEMYTRKAKKLKEMEEEFHKMQEWYAVAMEHVPSYERDAVLEETGQQVKKEKPSMLDSFIKRMMDEEEHTTEDYGWLAPDGTFYAVEWAEHQSWAMKYVEEHYPEVYEETDEGGDWLVQQKGWVLLHNPSQGIAFPTRSTVKEYTKAQREFLYDYYMERGCKEEANAIWKEE